MSLPTIKNSSNSEKHGCFLATPCHVRGAYFAQGERKILNLTALALPLPVYDRRSKQALTLPCVTSAN